MLLLSPHSRPAPRQPLGFLSDRQGRAGRGGVGAEGRGPGSIGHALAGSAGVLPRMNTTDHVGSLNPLTRGRPFFKNAKERELHGCAARHARVKTTTTKQRRSRHPSVHPRPPPSRPPDQRQAPSTQHDLPSPGLWWLRLGEPNAACAH